MAARQTDINEFMNQARANLPGSSDANILGTVYLVLKEFFNDSSCWTYNVELVAIEDERDYDLVVPEGQIIRLAGVVDGDNFAVPALMADYGTLNLQTPLQADADFTVTVILNTTLPVAKDGFPIVPDWLLPVWSLGILDGLLGAMFLQVGKGYSNKDMGSYHRRRFRDAIARARVEKLHRNTVGAQAWSFPRSFRRF
jgi:hypothetical protein